MYFKSKGSCILLFFKSLRRLKCSEAARLVGRAGDFRCWGSSCGQSTRIAQALLQTPREDPAIYPCRSTHPQVMDTHPREPANDRACGVLHADSHTTPTNPAEWQLPNCPRSLPLKPGVSATTHSFPLPISHSNITWDASSPFGVEKSCSLIRGRAGRLENHSGRSIRRSSSTVLIVSKRTYIGYR